MAELVRNPETCQNGLKEPKENTISKSPGTSPMLAPLKTPNVECKENSAWVEDKFLG